MIDFEELIGLHDLDAVDFSNEKVLRWGSEYEDAQVCRFRLDGNVYVAIEDPEDGYRSSMKQLFIQDEATMTNAFPPIYVMARHRTKGRYSGEDDVLELVDTVTGNVVLEVGTDNIDDYYPGFVASFHPENMATNIGVAA